MADWYDEPSSEAFANHFGLEDEPDADESWHRYFRSLQRPTAFLYAVRVASGIKIGFAGSGDKSDPVEQLCSRLTSYRSISPIQVLGLMAVEQRQVKREEAQLHSRFKQFLVPNAGRELFQDCEELTSQLLELMWPSWHDDALGIDASSELFAAMQEAAEAGTIRTAITEYAPAVGAGEDAYDMNPSKGWFTPYFGWRDWACLHRELALFELVRLADGDVHYDLERYASDMGWLPDDFGEHETDDLAVHLLEHVLPPGRAKRSQLRSRFDLWVKEDPAHGFQPWWDSALERNNLTAIATS